MRKRLFIGLGALVLVAVGAALWYRQEVRPQPSESAHLELERLPADTRVLARINLGEDEPIAKLWSDFVARRSERSSSDASELPATCADPLRKVRTLVLSSSKTVDEMKADHAVIVRGAFGRASVERCVRELSRPYGPPRVLEGWTLHRGAGEKWIAIASDEAVVFGTFERVKQVLETFAGRATAATAETVPDLAAWERASDGHALLFGALLPPGYAAKSHADYTLLAKVLDVKSILLTADLESDKLVLRVRLQASDAARAEAVRTSFARLAKVFLSGRSDGGALAHADGSKVEATVALTKEETDTLFRRFRL